MQAALAVRRTPLSVTFEIPMNTRPPHKQREKSPRSAVPTCPHSIYIYASLTLDLMLHPNHIVLPDSRLPTMRASSMRKGINKSAVSSSASSSTTTMRTSFRSDRYPDFRHYHSSDAGSRYYSTGSTGWLLGESYSLGRSHRAAATRLFDTEVAVERRNSVNKTNLRMDESLARSMSNVDAIRDLLNPKPPVEQGRRVKNASSRHWTSGLARPSDNVAATDSAPERRKGLKLKIISYANANVIAK
ncbi:hypothetical protein TIFTF001_049826 [Ficus carica]|uniref:Uncharacterized protein n=1 Tax=Ficus carica TaxID=3494 RepID=A0AA87Z4N4_FICCA|nr:hypothetical protein TIFTF001_049826 [Ficus carica]